MAQEPQPDGPPAVGVDAVCFTAGAKGAAFAAGTIHAYLAARRPAPALVAGISMGSLGAAAMQRAYAEWLRQGNRWSWFRQYVDSLTQQPLDVVWDALPDQSDFFADMPPIRNLAASPFFRRAEAAARRRRYLLVKLGRWLARLPVSVRDVTRMLVSYVRCRERYPMPQRLASAVAGTALLLVTLFRVSVHLCTVPQFFPVHRFRTPLGRIPRSRLRTVRAWLNLCSLTLAWALLIALAIGFYVAEVASRNSPEKWEQTVRLLWVPTLLAILGSVGSGGILKWLRQRPARWAAAKRYARPVIVIVSVGFSVVNAALLLGIAASVVVAIATRQSGYLLVTFVLFIVWLWLNVCFSLGLFVPSARRWLVRHDFLEQWPRPLFGWLEFLVLWINGASLAAFLSLGLGFLALASHPDWHCVVLVTKVLASMVAVLALPLAALGLAGAVWSRLKPIASARSGWRAVTAVLLSIVVVVATMLLGTRGCEEIVQYVRGLLADTKPWVSFPKSWNAFVVSAFGFEVTWLLILAVALQPVLRRWLFARVLRTLETSRGILSDYALRVRLAALFDPELCCKSTLPRKLGDDPMPCLLVAAPLQSLPRLGPAGGAARQRLATYQLWATRGAPLVGALRTCLALPPLWEPTHVEQHELGNWVSAPLANQQLDLVDGAAIRHNPLPAVFTFLKRHPNLADRMARANSRERPALHVVYCVPIRGREGRDAELMPEQTNIVDVFWASLELAARRDTQLEVEQTNFIARLEEYALAQGAAHDGTFRLYADEIAPEEDVEPSRRDPLKPERTALLGEVAHGCRKSLETLYRLPLQRRAAAVVGCGEFLGASGAPGLPEVCERCTGQLATRSTPVRPWSQKAVESLAAPRPGALAARFPQLTGVQPRIVFVASGGVFRGAFHIGMLAALMQAGIKPDLIVGASVGTLMGAALAAMCSAGASWRDNLARLVDVFLRVDEEVALTVPLKRAARELGVRGREIALSPHDIRKMLRKGSRSDPGYAVSGAPAALIDAISVLSLMPPRKTRDIAAAFVAGEVTTSVQLLLQEIKEGTLRRLGIERAVLGTSLLETVVRDLLGIESGTPARARQPFQSSAGIAFFGTTTNLGARSPVLLGGFGAHPASAYDLLEAALASSAFPCVFAPRRESDVYPGHGNPHVYFSDGGMFDNLPFLPALGILSLVQRDYRTHGEGAQLTARDFLKRRAAAPDLFLAGALNVLPETGLGSEGPFDTLGVIVGRAKALQENGKIRAFQATSQRINRQVERILAAPSSGSGTGPDWIDRIVNAGVLPVFPATTEHLNGTFAFCRSLNLSPHRVRRSIANGCFETLSALAEHQSPGSDQPLAFVAVQGLVGQGRIPALRKRGTPAPAGVCPFVESAGADLSCPFHAATKADATRSVEAGVHAACVSDPVHRQAFRRGSA